jgi:hypothetical protein
LIFDEIFLKKKSFSSLNSIIYPVRNVDALVNVPAKENQVITTLFQFLFSCEMDIGFAGGSQEIPALGVCSLCT